MISRRQTQRHIYVIYFASHNFLTDLTVGHTSHILTYRSHYEKASVSFKKILLQKYAHDHANERTIYKMNNTIKTSQYY